jgi:membrane protein YqaA with SNARE-associated domain
MQELGPVQLNFLTPPIDENQSPGSPELWTFSRAKGTLLRHLFQALWLKWKLVILPVLIKWGILGAGAVAVLDSSTIPVPMDALIAVWVWKDQGHFWAYCLLAAFGSAIGGLLPYGLGRAGGELFILKRVNRERYERMKLRFEKQEFLAMAIPSALPPPTPWKAFVFAAGVFEMRVIPFMLAVFTGRLVRWLVLSLLVIKLGPGAVGVVQHHALTVLLAVGGVAVAGFGVWWMSKRRSGEIRTSE